MSDLIKVCRLCNQAKSKISDFYRKASSKDGRQSVCILCDKKRVEEWRKANPERSLARVLRYQNAHPEVSAAWKKRNSKQLSEKGKQWRIDNPQRWAELCARYRRNNPEKIADRNAMRRAVERRATPSWSIRFFVTEAYALAKLRTKVTGIKWEVDHIVPLNSPLVCGLHAHTNIQVIPKSENHKKMNLHWPDMAKG